MRGDTDQRGHVVGGVSDVRDIVAKVETRHMARLPVLPVLMRPSAN